MLVLGRIGAPPTLLLGYAAAALVVILTVMLAAAFRRRGAQVVLPILAVGVLLSVAALTPEPDWVQQREVAGQIQGNASFNVFGNPVPDAIEGGSIWVGEPSNITHLTGRIVVVSCATPCRFRLADARIEADPLRVEVDGESFSVAASEILCERTPLLLRPLARCLTCGSATYTAPPGARGDLEIRPLLSPVC